jgi:hypothetical protein
MRIGVNGGDSNGATTLNFLETKKISCSGSYREKFWQTNLTPLAFDSAMLY